ncbi:hypothetical protein [Flavobacterium sp. DSP2-3-1]
MIIQQQTYTLLEVSLALVVKHSKDNPKNTTVHLLLGKLQNMFT